MLRPEQHITETKAQRIFQNIIPDEWVAREVKPDYGVDYIIEVFNQGHSTGKNFFVQLKGSTQEIENNTFNKQFEISNLEYYSSLTLPVLIVCVSVTTEQVWCIWSNNLLEAYNLKENQGSLSVSLDEKYTITKQAFSKLYTDLNSSKKFGLSINIEDQTTKLLSNSILKWVNYFFNNTISTEFKYLPNHIELNYSRIKNNGIKLTINAFGFKKEVIVKNVKEDNVYLHRPMFNEDDINEINKNILKTIAIGFAKYDTKGSLSLLRKLVAKAHFNVNGEMQSLDPMGLLVLAQANNELPLFNKLVRDIIDLNLPEAFFFFDVAYFAVNPRSEDLRQYRIENLSHLIKTTKDNSVKGTAHYNLGNILRSMGSDLALFHYFQARKLLPNYLERSYWWREMAGLLFSKGHFKAAERFYRKSQEESGLKEPVLFFRLEEKTGKEDNLVTALIADCLFFQGKFHAAHIVFQEYLKENDSTVPEWVLKNFICVEFMSRKLDSVKIDAKASLELCEKALSLSSNAELIKILQEALKLNPLNGLAWFNLGVALDRNVQFEDALLAFLFAGVIQEWDKEAQFNAMTIALTQKTFEFLEWLLLFIIHKHGYLVTNDISDYIMNKNVPLDDKKKIINAFNELIQGIKEVS